LNENLLLLKALFINLYFNQYNLIFKSFIYFHDDYIDKNY
jgi:hypothetical protein